MNAAAMQRRRELVAAARSAAPAPVFAAHGLRPPPYTPPQEVGVPREFGGDAVLVLQAYRRRRIRAEIRSTEPFGPYLQGWCHPQKQRNARPKRSKRPEKSTPIEQSVARVIRETALYYRLPENFIMGRGRPRKGHTVLARHVAMYLARKVSGLSTVELGVIFRRDRTVIGYAVKKTARAMKADEQLARDIETISAAATRMPSSTNVTEFMPVVMRCIAAQAATHFGVDGARLLGRDGSQELLYPRMVTMLLCRTHADVDLARIGKLFGGRSKDSIRRRTQEMAKLRERDPKAQADIDAIERALGLAQ